MRSQHAAWALTLLLASRLAFAGEAADKSALSRQLWPKERVQAALQAIEQQRKAGLLSEAAYQKRKKMLQERRLSAIIPGVNTPDQLEENVKGSYERQEPADAGDKEALRQCTENFYANLTPEYQWLRQWETV